MTTFDAPGASILALLFLIERGLIPQFEHRAAVVIHDDGTTSGLSDAGRQHAREYISALGYDPDALTTDSTAELLRVIRTINTTTFGEYETNN